MGHDPTIESARDFRREGDEPERVDASPQDPETNTRPRGNGARDGGETEKSEENLENVLGH